MADQRMKCIHCEVGMDQGYLVDHGHGDSAKVAKWVGDPPDVRWYGLRTSGHDQIPLAAYRCPRCGYVEFRAVPTGGK